MTAIAAPSCSSPAARSTFTGDESGATTGSAAGGANSTAGPGTNTGTGPGPAGGQAGGIIMTTTGSGGQANGDAATGPCVNLQCRQTTCVWGNCTQKACAAGSKTTLSGIVYDPA